MSPPASPTGSTQPRITSSIAALSSSLRSRMALSAWVASSSDVTVCSAPSGLPRPRGVRTWSKMKQSVIGLSQAAGNHQLHDLVGAAIDALHPGVAIHAGDRELVHIAIAAKELQTAIDDRALQIGETVLRHRRGGGVEAAAEMPFDAMIDEHPRH